jgi:hypothetical protein
MKNRSPNFTTRGDNKLIDEYWKRYWEKELENMLPPDSPDYYIIDSKKCDWCPFYKEKWPMSACVKSRCRNISTSSGSVCAIKNNEVEAEI